MNGTVRVKLSIMMLLQYAVWGSWAVSMGGYLNSTLKFSGSQIGAIYSTTAIAAMIAPLFVGYIADRLFATERVIGVLHLAGAGLLYMAAFEKDPTKLFQIMIVYSLCYMPTLALTNSLSFANIGIPEKDFPGIRVFGTWGWIFAGWIVGFGLDGTTNQPVLMAAGLSGLLGVFSFFLPHTPPRGKLAAGETRGAGVLTLLKDPTFLVFVVCSFLICIPLSLYYGFANAFLGEIEAPSPTALQTIGQMSEVGFMAAMPFFITRLGVKKMLAIGMLAWVARYLCFGTLNMPLVILGLVLHGICYDFFFVASQIYVDNRASADQRASAQSFIAFVTLGVGMFVGAYVGGYIVDNYPSPYKVAATKTTPDGKSEETTDLVPEWKADGSAGFAKEFSLKPDSTLTAELIDKDLVETSDAGTTTYKSKTLADFVEKGVNGKSADRNKDGKIDRPEWVLARQRLWFEIWMIPAVAALATCILFWIGFKDIKKVTA